MKIKKVVIVSVTLLTTSSLFSSIIRVPAYQLTIQAAEEERSLR